MAKKYQKVKGNAPKIKTNQMTELGLKFQEDIQSSRNCFEIRNE